MEYKSQLKVEYWIERGFNEKEAVIKKNEILDKQLPMRKAYWLLKGFDEDEAVEKVRELQSSRSKKNKNHYLTIDYWTEKGFSFAEAEIKITAAKAKISKITNRTIEYWINKGFTIDESKKIISENQSIFSKKRKEKYGDKLKEFCNTNKQYWINKGYSESEAKERIHKRQQTFSLKKCIEKYGEVEGNKKWKERQTKWLISLKSKTDEEKNKINKKRIETANETRLKNYSFEKYEKYLKTKLYKLSHPKLGSRGSKIANYFFDKIQNEIPDIKFVFGDKEKYIKLNEKRNGCFVDFYFPYKKKIIEFYGDYWHANPEIYPKDKKIKFYGGLEKFPHEVWLKDENRINKLIENGYKVLVVWQNDVKNNEKEIMTNCIKFLKYD